MRTYFQCLPCFAKQAVNALPMIDEAAREDVMRDVMRALAEIDFATSPPQMAKIIFDIIKKRCGNRDFYAEAKKKSNAYVLESIDSFREMIDTSSDPFETALRLAIAGNVIDFGAKHDFSDHHIHDNIDSVLNAEIPKKQIEALRSAIDEAANILYLGDNAGEIVFDTLFIEQFPKGKTTFAVRGAPVINDVLMEDAEAVGMIKLVPVIDNGADVPGTVLSECSESFKKTFAKADLVISKGQGNYETLNDMEKHIFFLLKIKCDVVARDSGYPLNSFVVMPPKNGEAGGEK